MKRRISCFRVKSECDEFIADMPSECLLLHIALVYLHQLAMMLRENRRPIESMSNRTTHVQRVNSTTYFVNRTRVSSDQRSTFQTIGTSWGRFEFRDDKSAPAPDDWWYCRTVEPQRWWTIQFTARNMQMHEGGVSERYFHSVYLSWDRSVHGQSDLLNTRSDTAFIPTAITCHWVILNLAESSLHTSW